MKHVIIAFSLVISIGISANQKIESIAELLPLVYKEAAVQFTGIIGEQKDNKLFKTTLTIKNVADNYISTDKTELYLDFGNYSAEDKAKLKMDSVQKAFLSCNANYYIKTSNEDFYGSPLTTMSLGENFAEGFILYDIVFEVRKIQNNGAVAFVPKVIINQNIDGTTFYKLTEASDKKELHNAIMKIIEARKSQFSQILGDDIEDISGFNKLNASKLCLPNASDCIIVKQRRSSIFYCALGKSFKDTEFQNIFNQYVGTFTKAMGSDYLYTQNLQAGSFAFTKVGEENRKGNFSIMVTPIVLDESQKTFIYQLTISGLD